MTDLSLRRISKSFGKVDVLRDIGLEVKDGEFVVFVGPSGCGKSTLLRVIAGLEKPTSGDILLAGTRVNDVPAADRGLAMVFQSYALYPHMTVRQNLAFGLENTKTPKAEVAERVAEITRMLRIEPLLQRKPRQLSGGQRQRVAIGRAMVRRPGIFLLDEPLSNLDADLRITMRAELAALHQRISATMIYVTHDQVEAMTLAHRIVVLNEGRIEQVGRPLELFNEPKSRFVAGFIGSPKMNFVDGEVAAVNGGRVRLMLPGGAPLEVATEDRAIKVGDRLTVGVRPQHFALADGDGMPVEVVQVEQLGSETILYAKGDAVERLVLARPGQMQARPGDRVHIDLARTGMVVFAPDGRRVALRPPPQ